MVFSSVPEQSSKWTTGALAKRNIYYDDDATSISDFMSILKDRSNQSVLTDDLPEDREPLLDYTKTFFRSFSFDFDIRRTGGKRNTPQMGEERQQKINHGITKAETLREDLELENLDVFQEDKSQKSLGMLYVWRSNVLNFLGFFIDILRRWDHESHREGKFVYLFMLFCKVCLLRPEPGDSFKEMLCIKGTKVKGYPDVRFVGYPSKGVCKTVAVIEVKREHSFLTRNKKGDKSKKKSEKIPFIYQDVPENVLGQHGIELLLERKTSFFESGAAGIICIGTKVYFTFMDIDDDKFSKIKEKGKVKKADQVKIKYTEGFDYMKEAERNKLLEPLLKFALLQTQTSDTSSEIAEI